MILFSDFDDLTASELKALLKFVDCDEYSIFVKYLLGKKIILLNNLLNFSSSLEEMRIIQATIKVIDFLIDSREFGDLIQDELNDRRV